MANKLAQLAGVRAKVSALPVNSEEIAWKARDALHTIHKAEEHRKDKPLMREIKKLAKAQVKAACK